MKNKFLKIIFTLSLSLLLSGCDLNNSAKIAQLDKQNQDLQTQLDKQNQDLQTQLDKQNQQQQTNNLTLQSQCSDMAKKAFNDNNYKAIDGFDYTNHYNSKQNKCFILISSYTPNNDSLTYDLYDTLERKHYAEYLGHKNCDAASLVISKDSKKCQLDSGNIWLDGDDTKNPADYHVGFGGLINGGAGDEHTLKEFMDHIQPLLND